MKKIIGIVLVALMTLTLTGCWNRVELNEIAIISGTAVDWKDGQFQLSYQIVMPSAISSQVGGSSQGASVNVFSTQGDSLRGAINKASRELARRLYFSHNQVLVIGESAAANGLDSLFDAYLRNTDSRETVSVFLTKGNGRTILEQLIPLEKIPGSAIQRMMENESRNGSATKQMTMHEVLVELFGAAKATAIPGLTVAGTQENMNETTKLSQTNTPSKVRLAGTGLLYKDKLSGWLTPKESIGVMWIADQIKKTTVSFSCPDSESQEKSSAIRIIYAKTKLTPKLIDGQWSMDVSVKTQGSLVELKCDNDMGKPKEVAKLERQIAAEIQRMMESGWMALSATKTDVVGFGKLLREKHPDEWKQLSADWPENFAAMKLNYKVKVKINSTGMSGTSFKKTQEQSGP
ncbi:Ger(x)C family spore germination protein [Paenibacillus sp. NEAU-GSW1]|uniref:Ger(x)C family spore germination protein n=1 Tax=Paenibacillus sp. NEAU-GSW1 TaxID=2682486 RepID=UPI0012E1396B|nr:Ger(x)C family spore germination protein [Paenibacillus sp. NEAU-GSW1]MUT66294.1 Ger(x)C family spore germination protein [Paenibacillus sp. NEAU-GSW1]